MNPKPFTPYEIRRAIIDHVARYRLSVLDALQNHPSLIHVHTDTLKRQLNNLVDKNILHRATLHGTRPYYYLHRNGHPSHRSSAVRSMPCGAFSEQAKIRCYAMLAFCRLTSTPRTKLLASELAAICPELARPGLPGNYYAEEIPGSNRLGYAYLDAGGYGRWDRIVERMHYCIDFHRGLLQLGQLVEDGRFEFAIVTTFSQKADRIHDALRSQGDLNGIAIHVCVVPELLYLIAPPRPLPYATRTNTN